MNEYMKKVITEKGWTVTPTEDGTVEIGNRTKMGIELSIQAQDTPANIAQAINNHIEVVSERMREAAAQSNNLKVIELKNVKDYVRALAEAVSPWQASGKKVCPICGSHEFLVTAHVTQDWVVNGDGDFLACTDECTEVTHKPDDEDIWVCSVCGHDGSGEDFNPKG